MFMALKLSFFFVMFNFISISKIPQPVVRNQVLLNEFSRFIVVKEKRNEEILKEKESLADEIKKMELEVELEERKALKRQEIFVQDLEEQVKEKEAEKEKAGLVTNTFFSCPSRQKITGLEPLDLPFFHNFTYIVACQIYWTMRSGFFRRFFGNFKQIIAEILS